LRFCQVLLRSRSALNAAGSGWLPASDGARTIIVESPDRFARDLMVQLAGHDMLKARGVTLIAASAPLHFIEDTPTAVLVRQVLSAVAEFEKTTLVAKLAATQAHGDR
jgi:DNA invertase Pin-like site-specific DNA recombinase